MVRCGLACAALTAILATGAVAAHTGAAQSPAPSAKSPISVADVVGQTLIGDPMSVTWNDIAARASSMSPDGRHVAIVLRRGDPQQGTNNAELLVYRTADLFDDPQPQVVAEFASATNYQPIALVRWLADSRTLVFAGTQGVQSQVYRVDVRTLKVDPLTDLRSPLQWYDITPAGDWLATMSEPDATSRGEQDPECQRRGCRVTAETLRVAQYGGTDMSAPIVLHELTKGNSRTLAPPEANDPDLVDCRDELKGGLSPNGRFGLRNCKLRRYSWPSWWGDYTAPPDLKAILSKGNNGYLRQWILYDFERGTSSRLTSAPYFSRAAPLWIDGGRRFILAGAFEPLTDVDADERTRRSAHYAVLVVDPATRKTQRVAEFDSSVQRVTAASWNDRTETLTVEYADHHGRSIAREVSRRADGRWSKFAQPDTSNANTAATRGQPRLSIKQSLNDRPVLIATNPQTGATAQVLDPNPWLAERAVGRVEVTSWESKDGRKWRGGIYYPADYRPGERYPVVLQTHGFEDNVFSLYGIARNFAAQPLAGLGILVLQIDENTKGAQGADQWPAARAGYESAIDHLDTLGLIDRNRVGIQGWSWTGPTMGYTLTKSPYKFVAGAFTVTADFGWWWYLSQGARHGESEYGMPPFGEGLDVWQKMSPSFNLDRINTPMLMCSDGVTVLWDWYVGLRRLGKPVEYWSLPQVTHDVFKVDERMLMNQLTVDWFRFWLKAEEDPDPSKAEQYLRWRELRRQQELSLGNLGSHVIGAR
jgi:hypothetical protein